MCTDFAPARRQAIELPELSIQSIIGATERVFCRYVNVLRSALSAEWYLPPGKVRKSGSPREIARDHDRRGVGTASLRCLRLVRRLKKKLVHNIQDLLVRLNHACRVEILANLAEHVAALGIDRAHGKGVRIGLGVRA